MRSEEIVLNNHNLELNNLCSVVKYTIIKSRINSDRDDISSINANAKQFKKLTLDIINSTLESGNTTSMYDISSTIDKWKDDIVGEDWKSELRVFCAENNDIQLCYSAMDENNRIFVLVTEDQESDKVFDYIEYCFEFKNKYKDTIDDFMVLDSETAGGVDDLFREVQNIYTKG